MNILIKYFVLLKLVTELCSVNAYTVLLKPVLPLYPTVRVYKYDVRHPKIFKEPTLQYVQHAPIPVQRIYPAYVKHQQNQNFRTVFPIKKEKRKYKIKIAPTTEKSLPREQRLHDLQQELVPPISNQLEEYTESKEESSEGSKGDVTLSVPGIFDGDRFPSFGQERGRLYNKPGDWAVREPHPDSGNSTESNFTPSQLYLQVRHKNTVIHVPQSEALKDAETLEELINAPRLKELARITHVQEMYSEEGYEDAGYDHAGQIRHAQHGEVYNAKDEGKFNIRDPPIILDYDSERDENENVQKPKYTSSESESVQQNVYDKPEQNNTASNSTDVRNSSAIVTTPVPDPVPKFIKKEHVYSSSHKQPIKIDTFIENTYFNSTDDEVESPSTTTAGYTNKRSQAATESILIKVPNLYLEPPPPKNFSSRYRQKDGNITDIYDKEITGILQASNLTDTEPPMDSMPSPSAKSLKYSRIYSKKTKQLRLEPFKSGTYHKPIPTDSSQMPLPTDKPMPEGVINQRIVLPTIGYINSLTTAHFGKGNSAPLTDESKAQLTKPLNLTQALNYLRSNKKEKQDIKLENVKNKTMESSGESDITFFEPKRLKTTKLNAKKYGKNKRDVLLVGQQINTTTSENYEGNDESDLPHDEKNKEIEEDEQKRIEEENIEKEKYEKDLKDEISDAEKEVLKETYKNIGIEEDISEAFPELPSSSFEDEQFFSSDLKSNKKLVDSKKYPFYFSKKLPENSALRYMTSPIEFPNKSGQRMEFYESREKLIQCPEFHPPMEEVPGPGSEAQGGENPRLINLGDKIACLRAKYFDVDPFDSPFFKEKDIEYVGKPNKLKKALLPNSSKIKSKLRAPYLLKKQNQKVPTAPPLNVPNSQGEINSQAKFSENQNPDRNKQIEEVVFPSRHKYLKIDKEAVDKSPMSGEVVSSTEKPNRFFLPKQPSSTYLMPQTETLAAAQKENLQPLTNVRIALPRNCVPSVNAMKTHKGSRNIVMDCSNSLQNPSIKSEIVPPLQSGENNFASNSQSYQTDWVPMVGYILPKNTNNSFVPLNPVSRIEDDVSNKTSEAVQNVDSDHYVIDELVEEENVRKGEVVDDMDHYYKLLNETKPVAPDVTELKEVLKEANNTREKRGAGLEAINPSEKSTQQFNSINSAKEGTADLTNESNHFETSRPFQTKRTLSRLSGKDFLNRYHSKNRKKTSENKNSSDFWKVSTPSSTPGKSQPNSGNKKSKESEKPKEELKEKKAKQLNEKGKEIKDYINLKAEKKAQVTPKIVPKSPDRTARKLEAKQSNEFRKVPLLNLIPERVTKKQEPVVPTFKNEKTTIRSPSRVKINSTKESKIVVTKIISEVTETTEKYKTIRRKSEETATTASKTYENIERRPNDLRTSNFETPKKNEKERTSQYIEESDGPTLYYIVDERTGRGRWISSHDKRRKLPQNSNVDEGVNLGFKAKSIKGRRNV